MVMRTLKGIVRGGKIELAEALEAPEGTEVNVTLPMTPEPAKARMISRGMFFKKDAHGLTEQDVADMKRILEREWDRSWDRLEKQ
jgi:hypothetical protein